MKVDEKDKKIESVSKPYVQFSKKVIAFLLINLIVIEVFTMFICIWLRDLSPVSYLITSIAATMLSGVIWYMKNSEAEKKARINAEIEKYKVDKGLEFEIEEEPDTYYKSDDSSDEALDGESYFPVEDSSVEG